MDCTHRNQNKYCNFHKDVDHKTKDCIQLRDQIELLVRDWHLREFVKKAITPASVANRTGQVWVYPALGTGNWTNAREPEHIVYTIFRGTTTGDTTRIRRNYARDTRQVVHGNTLTWPNISQRCPVETVSRLPSPMMKPTSWSIHTTMFWLEKSG